MYLVIILIISSISLFLFLAYKAWEYKADPLAKHERMIIDRKVLEYVLRSVLLSLKNHIRDFLIWLTKVKFKISTTCGNFFKERFPKVYALFSTKHAIQLAQESESKSTSFFFRTVAEYKYKIKKTKQALHKEAEEKALEEEIEKETTNTEQED